MSSSGTPAGWYPDPENPGQTRYWDGTAWAAPSGAPVTTPTPPTGGGSSGGKIALIAVAVIVVLGLIGGGVWALTSGDDDDDQETTSDDDDDDDGDGPEELAEDDFADEVERLCMDSDDALNDVGEDFAEAFADVDDIEDIDPDVLRDLGEDIQEIFDDAFADLRSVAPEGRVDEWLDVVDEWQDIENDLLEFLEDGEFPDDNALEAESEIIEEVEDEFDVSCLNSMGSDMSSDTSASTEGADDVAVEVDPSGGSDDIDHGPPSEPPAFDDPELESLGEDCYQGDMDACTDIYIQSDFDSPEETYGVTCGGRTSEEDFVFCPNIEDPITP